MGRKKVPLRDKALIKKRLAQGKSQREAIKGTVVKHHTTAGNLAKRELADISRLQENYIKLIEKFESGDVDRAKLWAEMIRATKLYGRDAIEHPDWANREKALRYIDSLKGISGEKRIELPIQQTQVNIFTRLKKEDSEFIEGEEVKG